MIRRNNNFVTHINLRWASCEFLKFVPHKICFLKSRIRASKFANSESKFKNFTQHFLRISIYCEFVVKLANVDTEIREFSALEKLFFMGKSVTSSNKIANFAMGEPKNAN